MLESRQARGTSATTSNRVVCPSVCVPECGVGEQPPTEVDYLFDFRETSLIHKKRCCARHGMANRPMDGKRVAEINIKCLMDLDGEYAVSQAF